MNDDDVPDQFFEGGGSRYFASVLVRGPWDPNSAHGGPVAALIGREVAIFDPDPELVTTRLTLELLRPVPVGELELATTMLRPGRRVRLVGVSVLAAGVEVTRAVALRIRRTPGDAPDTAAATAGLPPPEDCEPLPPLALGRVGIMDGLDFRGARGTSRRPGPAAAWIRMLKPLVNDDPITPLDRALVAADFCNGLSSVVPFETHVFINPDLTVNLHREPLGDWVYNAATTSMHPRSGAVAEGRLGDSAGEFGTATQCLYVDSR